MRRGNQRKFGRPRKQRQALSKSLVTALIDHGRITTTAAKAKLLSSTADKLVTIAKKNTLASRRHLTEVLHERMVQKLITELAPKFAGISGGYTQITPLGQRKSDGAPMASVAFTH